MDKIRKLVHETLKQLEPEIPYSMDTENLICGTIAQESAYGKYRRQIGGGPALGIPQMEPATFHSIVDDYLDYRPHIWNKIAQISNVLSPNSNDLVDNDKLAICMCRVQYYRQKEAIPKDLVGWARYWKKYYNTYKGKGTVEEFINNYNKYVNKN